jgi:hypothetical protein
MQGESKSRLVHLKQLQDNQFVIIKDLESFPEPIWFTSILIERSIESDRSGLPIKDILVAQITY